jgi:hypothetical protein
LDAILTWARRRSWVTDKNASYVFQGVLVFLTIVFTGYLVNIRVVATGWAQDDVIYASVEKMFQDNGISPMDVVIVPNPPGYYVRTGRSAVCLPLGDESAVLSVAKEFNAMYLVLERSDTLGVLQGLYEDPHNNAAFVYLGETEGARLYRIESFSAP